MLRFPISSSKHRSAKSSALVIVLFFVALLSIVAIAFLARSTVALRASASSAGETKSRILASSASDIIIGDLKLEIIAGSAANAGTPYWPVYVPTSNMTMIPFMNGVPMFGTPATNEIPNLISRSVSPANTSASSGWAPYVSYSAAYTVSGSTPPANRAASDSTALLPTLATSAPYTTSKVNSSYPSLNGRYISPAQWNSHYLIPRLISVDPLGSTSLDSTPATNFVTPDWVIVTRGGANSVTSTTPGFGTSGLNDSTVNNVNYALGRYAYAIYNEGGLLDMNAAGYPGTDSGSGSTGLTANQIGEKVSLALADLTQLTAGTTSLTQAQINNFVGWRNYATAQPSGSYGNFTFTSAHSTSWLTNFAAGNTNGFMQIVPAGVTSTGTDQAVLSRQQLISVTQSLGMSPDFLQYMGTFSRALEQPSYVPDPNRPKILTTGGAPPVITSADSYTGNNNAQAGDTDPQGINPSFLTVGVQSTFTRCNGSGAVVGEPLVKTKFPLSYLSWITYLGPSATRTSVINNNASAYSSPTSTDYDVYLMEYKYGISNAFLQQGTAANVLSYFGLTYLPTALGTSTPSSSWLYWDGSSSINTLIQVQSANREADFAELLKAAILAGSVAKGGPNYGNGNNVTNYQYGQDIQVDKAVLQIMANLIDQNDCDSYPTTIIFYNPALTLPIPSTSLPTTVVGTEDLPYFYRFNNMAVADRLPNPYFSRNLSQTFTAQTGDSTTGTLATSQAVNLNTGATQGATWTCSNSHSLNSENTYTTGPTIRGVKQFSSPSLVDAGEETFFFVPTIWNPHDPNNASATSSVLRPSNFRIYGSTADPQNQYQPWKMVAESEPGSPGPGYDSTKPNPQPQTTWAGTTVIPEQDGSYNYNWRISSALNPMSSSTSAITFNDISGTLFREPTLLWNNHPWSSLPAAQQPVTSGTLGASVTDINTGLTYYGLIQGKAPISFQATFASNKPGSWTGTANVSGNWSGQINGTWIFEGETIVRTIQPTPVTTPATNPYNGMVSFVMQYQDPASPVNTPTWISYDQKSGDLANNYDPTIVSDVADDDPYDYVNPWPNVIFDPGHTSTTDYLGCQEITMCVTSMDPRTARWGMAKSSPLGQNSDGLFLLEPTANSTLKTYGQNVNTLTSAMKTLQYNVVETDRARADPGNWPWYSTPCNTATGLRNATMRWFSAGNYFNTSPRPNAWPYYYLGLFSQNNFQLKSGTFATDGATLDQIYNEDPDGVNRPAMAAYNLNFAEATTSPNMSSQAPATPDSYRYGLPMATASILNDSAAPDTTKANGGITAQSQSRPLILNRPFTSVAEMSYAFKGTPWRNIDFFHPSSGDSALLDTFCVSPAPPNAMVAGKVDLNTRQIPVLQAIEAGANIDEINSAVASPPSYALPPLTGTEAKNIATTLETITSDSTHAWRGPIQNIAGLVGRYVANPGTTSDTDLYTYAPPSPVTGQTTSASYAGLSSALDCSTWLGSTGGNHVYASTSTPVIQRFRESAIRPLAAAGQVRVWNLLIDIVAQTGFYPKTATGLDQFFVNGQTRLWVHVAIDRYTGQVIDKQVEVVTP